MVGTDPVEVERQLRGGGLGCPCGGGLGPWGHARERTVRGVGPVRPRRARCGSCLATHVLLAVSCLLRRADGVEAIGAALRLKATGVGHRPIAAVVGRPPSTVRGWLRAFARNAEAVRARCTVLLAAFDPLAGPTPARSCPFADAVEAVGACAAAARRRLGPVGAVSPWQTAAGITDGLLLAVALAAEPTNTN